jgi:hypothetical protein
VGVELGHGAELVVVLVDEDDVVHGGIGPQSSQSCTEFEAGEEF